MNCDRKHVMITGTSSGIGKETMQEALSAGWHVFAGDRSTDDPAVDQETGGGILTNVHVDVTKEDQVVAAHDVIAQHVGSTGLNGLANVAGIGIPGPLEIMPLSDLRFSFEVDVIGQVAMTQALLPLIRPAKGRIVFIGSIADRTTLPFFGALASSKHAIAAISDTFRQELVGWGIDVVLIEPGFISTGADQATKARIDQLIADFTPEQASLYGEMFTKATNKGFKTQTSGSTPDVVAKVILKALTTKSPKAHYLTGSKSHLMAEVAKLPTKAQDELKRKEFDMPEPGSLPD